MSDRPRVFSSYARCDGEQFARMLRRRLETEQPEISLWQDRTHLEGGLGWWKQIAEAQDVVEVLVLVMTPGALQSPITRKEWQYARQQGARVYPVKADPKLNFRAMPQWMHKAHFYDLEHEWEKFVTHLTRMSQCAVKGLLFPVGAKPTRQGVAPVGSTWSGGRR